MKILQISSASGFGGGERHFVDLTNGLAQRGHDLHVALNPQSPLISHLKIAPENILALPLRNALDISSAWKLRKFTRARQIEIIHAHVARDYPLAALAAGQSGRAKLVLTRHVLFPLSSVHRLTRRRVARIIAVSEAVAENLSQQNIFDADQISVIRHGIDLDRFDLRDTPGPQGSDRMLFVGMLGELSEVKGQEDFVRAAAILAPQTDYVKFVIAGRDNSREGKNRKDIEALIRELNLTDRIELIDSVEDVPAFLSRLDVFVSAAHSEAFGLAIVEAMACGVPVVATMTPGAQEIIDDSKTGRLVPIRDPAELARAINELLSDSAKRQVLAENARHNIVKKFSLKRMLDQTESLYRDVGEG